MEPVSKKAKKMPSTGKGDNKELTLDFDSDEDEDFDEGSEEESGSDDLGTTNQMIDDMVRRFLFWLVVWSETRANEEWGYKYTIHAYLILEEEFCWVLFFTISLITIPWGPPKDDFRKLNIPWKINMYKLQNQKPHKVNSLEISIFDRQLQPTENCHTRKIFSWSLYYYAIAS